MTKKDELAELKARIAKLEADAKAAAAPPEPLVPKPHQQYDPTANMTMPLSALRAMVNAVPDDFMRQVAMRDNRAPTGRPGMIPSTQGSGDRAPVNVPGSGTGWSEPRPLGPPPGIAYVDAQLIADDVKQRSKSKS